ncbi:unnamed protein product [Urochloa decumbens]|uniref:Uncharacterized protein n=1 Tax=Urochloa decumbens TaxID=240449 RepID=A0ABC9E2V3_9POAL
MDDVQAAPANRAVPYGVDEIHHEVAAALRARHLAWCAEIYYEVVALLHARPLVWWLRLGYFSVAAPVMALCAGLLDGPWAAGFAYAVLLLGVASTWSAMLPPGLLARVRWQVARAAFSDGNNHEVASPESAMAWCGYVLMAASVLGSSLGLAGTPGAALVAHTLLLLGFASISIAMLPLRPMERFLRESESRAVRNSNGNGIVPRADGMDWTGYFFVAVPVLASWAGLVAGPAAAILAFASLLLGVVFIIIAMRALAKPKMA